MIEAHVREVVWWRHHADVCECSLEVVWDRFWKFVWHRCLSVFVGSCMRKTCLEEAYICVIAYCGFGVMFLASAALALLLSFFDCWLNVCCLRCRCALLSLATPCSCLLAIRHLLIVAILSCRFSWFVGSLCRSHIRNAYPEKLEENIHLVDEQATTLNPSCERYSTQTYSRALDRWRDECW